MPCGNRNRPSPKLLTSFPEASNFITTGSFEPAQLFAPHRSAIQIERPSMSGSTVLIDPQSAAFGPREGLSTLLDRDSARRSPPAPMQRCRTGFVAGRETAPEAGHGQQGKQ